MNEVSLAFGAEGWKTLYCCACPYVVYYISRYICAVYSYPGVHGRFYGLDLKNGNGCLGKLAIEVARLVNDEENDYRFEVQREEHWIHTQSTRSVAVRERLLELFYD